MSTGAEGAKGGGKPRWDRSKVAAAVVNALLLGAAAGAIGGYIAGRMFVLSDQRKRFCSRQCAQRPRYRRWAEKKSEKQKGEVQ